MRLRHLAPVLLATRALAAQPAAHVSGIVYDSLAHAPLAGAEVQLVRADASDAPVRSATTDAAGRYRIDAVTPGRYVAEFLHPVLDSLGVTLAQRRVDVAGDSTRLSLAIPSAATLRRALCDNAPALETTGMLVGWVRDAATGRPFGAASVRVEWSELVLTSNGPSAESHGATVPTRNDGWFAACGVPAGTALRLRGMSSNDSSGVVPVQLTGGALVRRDLVVGVGRARLVGLVRSTSGRPIVGARVWLGADTVATNETGAFALVAPVGSRVLAARAVGYLPASVTVDVRPEMPNATTVTLASLSAYLDTVKTTRERVYAVDHGGFEARRRAAGSGHFVDRQQIERLGSTRTLSLLRTLPGVTGIALKSGESLLMRGLDGGYCSPPIFVDGAPIAPASGWEFDADAPVDRITGIEVYSSLPTTPVQYQRPRQQCGSIVIWTENARDPNGRRP